MTILPDARVELFGCLAFAILLATIVVMLVALLRKDSVKTGVHLRSFGFFLEAKGTASKRGKPRGPR
jgi:hypothetical protein